jgi:hypothetical protein
MTITLRLKVIEFLPLNTSKKGGIVVKMDVGIAHMGLIKKLAN